MPRAFILPRVEHLSAEPQLASLAVLETAANIAILALGAEYPELACRDVSLLEPPEIRAAIELVDLARDLDAAITRYRRALVEARENETDLLPF